MSVLLSLVAVSPSQPGTSGQITRDQYEQDFDSLWLQLQSDYAYFDYGLVDWNRARAIFRPKISQVKTKGDFIFVLESLLDQLCDPHTQLNTNTPASQRLVPSGARAWAELKGDRAFISELRSPSDGVGLRVGDEIEAINGVPLRNAIEQRIGPATHREKAAVRQYALMCLLAGTHDKDVFVTIQREGTSRRVLLSPADRPTSADSPSPPPVSYRLLPGNVGYIRLNNSLGDTDTIGAFDAALLALRQTKGLILDLRDTPGGGTTVVARGIMGRLVRAEAPYQKHADSGEQRSTGIRHAWLELVSPRGPFTYTELAVVLIDHWTGSMGEGMAIGLSAMHRARTVGTRMAGLLGAKRTWELPNTHIAASYAAEKLFTVKDVPRERVAPDVPVDLRIQKGADPILRAGLREVTRRWTRLTSP